MDDDSFLKVIAFPDLKKRYLKESKSLVREKEREFKQNYEKSKDAHQFEIRAARDHDHIINLCIHPFTESSSPAFRLGYKFIRADPLYELGSKNVDFLLYKREGKRPMAIFGEAKSQITNYSEALRDLSERRKIIEAKIDYIKANYLMTSSDPILEYVLTVPTSIGIEARDAIWKSGKETVLWLTDLYDLRVKIGQPPEEDGRQRMLHHDQELNNALRSEIRSLGSTFACFPQSHTLGKLKLLLECIERTSKSLTVTAEKLSKLIEIQMFYLDDEVRTAELAFILKEAERIGFVEVSNDVKGEYHIVSRSRKPSTLEAELESRWIDSRIQEAKKKSISTSIEKLQKDIIAQQNRRPTLFGTFGTQHHSTRNEEQKQ